MCGVRDDPEAPLHGKHRELGQSEIQKSETAVQRVIAAINGFTNPFTISDKNNLYNLASGAPVPQLIAKDVLEAESEGKSARDDFITKRFKSGESETLFFASISRLKLKTMEKSNKAVKLTSSLGNVSIKVQATARYYLHMLQSTF